MEIEVIATPRTQQGTGASRRLRRAGRVPAIVYGGGVAPQAIELDHNAIYQRLRQEAFHASILTLNLAGDKNPVLLRDVQMHPHKPIVLHVDFQRVAKDRKIHMKVPLHFVNADAAPGIKQGGIISHVFTEVDVSCLPEHLPEFLEVDLSGLTVGHSIHLSQVKLPAGVEALAMARGDDPVIAAMVLPRAAVVEESEAAAQPAVAAEPTEKKAG